MNAARLCMLVHGPYPHSEPRVAREARAALDAGFEVDIVAMRYPGEPKEADIDGARVYRLPHLRTRRRRWAALLYEYGGFTSFAVARVAALQRRRRYAVIQVHNPPDFLAVAALLPKLAGAKVILDIHDFAPDLYAMRREGRRGAAAVERALRLIESAAVRLADAVVTVHEPYRRELLKRGVPDRKIVVVLNALDERLMPAEAPAPTNGAFRILYHGTVTWHYGIELVVDAVAALGDDVPGARLEIYGDGDAVPAVRARAVERGIADRVSVSGRVLPQDEVLRIVNGASVGVVAQLPIERNKVALPTKLLEYVALGVPVVAPDVPAITQSFSDAELRFFHGGDAASLADAIRAVATDPEAARGRALAALERYRVEYRWPIYARRYGDLLERLAGIRRIEAADEPRPEPLRPVAGAGSPQRRG